MTPDDAEFEETELYAIDIVTSIGDGKLLDDKHTTIYKRAVDKNYHLKMKSSRFIFSEISQKFPIMPFSARNSSKFSWQNLVYTYLPLKLLELQPTNNVDHPKVKAWLALHVKSKKKGCGMKKKDSAAKNGDETESMDETNGSAQA
nr:hypothetical protein [Tanacetum cinerariifolium]GEZ57137.1 hypothetical protein [Tanacetum cinerariifolium]